jgi:hypothetical protein
MEHVKPFQTQKEMLLAYFSLVDGLCATFLAVQQARSPEVFEGRGIVIPESQVTAALGVQKEMEPHEGFSVYLKNLQARTKVSPTFRLTALFEKLNATDFQQLVILLALAPEFNRKYERIFAYLQDNINEKKATLGFAADLYGIIAPLDDKELTVLYSERHPMSRFVLNSLKQDKTSSSLLSRAPVCRRTTLSYLNQSAQLPDALTSVCSLLPSSAPAQPLTGQELADRSARFLGYFYQRKVENKTGLLQLWGTAGSGRRFVLQYAAHELHTDVLCIDCELLTAKSSDSSRDILENAISFCYLTGSIPALINFDFKKMQENDRERTAQRLLSELGKVFPAFAICGQTPLRLSYDPSMSVLQLTVPRRSITEQALFWERFTEHQSLPFAPDTELLKIANFYSLTPGQIREVLSIAEAECLSQGLPFITEAAVSHAVRLMCRPRLAALTEPLTTGFTWDDMHLEKESAELLQRLCDRIRYRWKVTEQWGFQQKLPYGKGISVLLYGPPGTGKTMAAQVLAREFGLDAYRVDMSRIMDKYIGETEKKLAELFDAAKDSNAILFFDEADALFAKRTEVSDSKDRYANVETAYLLQRMEEHNGISIMATNAAQNFDEAFKRRISFMVNLSLPSPETRKKLWHSVFPKEAPLSANASLDFFAERFELSGSSIKNIAVSAAYFAAAEGSPITRDCIARAVREEYLKTGRVLMEHELY